MLGKEFRTMWDFLSPIGSGDWLLSYGRILYLDQQWGVGKPHRLIVKKTKHILLSQRERESSTKYLHPPSTTPCSPGSLSILDLRAGDLSTALTCSFANVRVTFGLRWYDLLAC